MVTDKGLAAVAALLADGTRASFVTTLLDGRALPAGELARRARVTAPTASAHLGKLMEGGLLAMERSGRHRYYRLASPLVGQALEALQLIAPAQPVRSLREADMSRAIHVARLCYDHLAGRLGVALAQALVAAEVLAVADGAFVVTPAGGPRLAAFGLDLDHLRRQRRAFAPCCLDWSERRHHVAGALGAALAQRCFALGWIERLPGTRAVRVTDAGRQGLWEAFGLTLPEGAGV